MNGGLILPLTTKGVIVMNYIYHDGVKGMKWGHRRWTNPDGTLNAAGKQRYGNMQKGKRRNEKINNNLNKSKDILNSSGNIAREGGKMVDSISNMAKASSSKKDFSKMSDQELRAKVNRLNMEKQYTELTSNDRSRGAYYLGNVLDIVGSAVTVGASAIGIAVAIRQLKK